MLASERTRYIISQLNKNGIINLKNVAKELNISEATVRRDFEKLENEGKLKRVTGGATLTSAAEDPANTAELTMRAKRSLNYDGKLRAARKASEMVQDGECVFLDGGTSISAMAEFLEKRPIMIVTNSELIVRSLSNPTAKVILIGGMFLPHYSMSVGTLAQQMLQQFHFDRVFLGCTGIDLEEGFAYTNELDTLAIKRLAMDNGDRTYLLVDSSKLNRRSFCKLDALSAFENIFCDASSDIKDAPPNFVMV